MPDPFDFKTYGVRVFLRKTEKRKELYISEVAIPYLQELADKRNETINDYITAVLESILISAAEDGIIEWPRDFDPERKRLKPPP